MYDEIKRALVTGSKIGDAESALVQCAEKECAERKKHIHTDAITAQLIESGLSQPKGSIAHEMAQGFLEQFSKELGIPISKRTSWSDLAKALMDDEPGPV